MDVPPLTVAILLFDDVEVLDCCGPFEVFSVANRVAARRRLPEPFEVRLVSAGYPSPVVARGGLRLLPHAGLSGPADVVLVPGGVQGDVAQDEAVLAWLRTAQPAARTVASICTGAFVLAAAGLLDARPVTTHWEDVAELRERHPGLTVVDGVRFVDHGDVATSAGISAGLDISLHLVGRLTSPDLAAATARQMDYEPLAKSYALSE